MSNDTAEVDEGMDEFDRLMGADTYAKVSPEESLEATNTLRWGLVRKHVGDTGDPKMFARVESLLNGIDKQRFTTAKLNQDKSDGDATRDIAAQIFAKMVSDGYKTEVPTEVYEPELVDSGMPLLDGSLIQGDDTTKSVID